MRPARWLIAWIGLLAAQFAFAQNGPPVRPEPSEAEVKAAFLHKFVTYVEWPRDAFAAPDSPIVVGVLGAEEVAAELEKTVPARTTHERAVVVRRLKEGDSTTGVHLLFVGRAQPNPRAILQAAQQRGTLCVTEDERGLEMGSAINFVVDDERMGFDVSVEAAERNGTRISSRLLNVARRVVPRP